MTYTKVTYQVIVVADPTQDYAVRYSTPTDISTLPTIRPGTLNALYVRDDIPPPTRITVDQTRVSIPGELYEVSNVVTESLGIEPEVFVFKLVDDSFSHVATVHDMGLYPPTRAEAETGGIDYYRLSTAVVTKDTLANAESFAVYTLSRIDLLTQQYSEYKLSFEGEDTHVYTAP